MYSCLNCWNDSEPYDRIMSYTRWNALRAIAVFSATCSRYSQNVPSQCCSRNLLTSSLRSIRPTSDADYPAPLLLLLPVLLVLLMAMSVSLRVRPEPVLTNAGKLPADPPAASAPALAHEHHARRRLKVATGMRPVAAKAVACTSRGGGEDDRPNGPAGNSKEHKRRRRDCRDSRPLQLWLLPTTASLV
jgi:hypothetical protein